MSNMSKVRAMADKMVKELQLNPRLGLPDWAGLAWAISPYYNSRAYLVHESMPSEWLHKAKRIVAALDIAWQARREAAWDSRCGVRK